MPFKDEPSEMKLLQQTNHETEQTIKVLTTDELQPVTIN